MMSTAAQLVMASILNFFGMTPEAQEPPAGLQAYVFAETREVERPRAKEGKVYYILILEDAVVHC